MSSKMRYKDEDPFIVDTYDVSSIIAANIQHDRKYGWSHENPSNYTNLARHPESVVGDFYEIMAKQNTPHEAGEAPLPPSSLTVLEQRLSRLRMT
jgi:hypothetical protein